MANKYELPTTLQHALAVFNFKGKPLWNLSEGRRNVRVEITLLLDNQPTNKWARPVEKTADKPTKQPTEQPQTKRTPPPTTATQMETTPPPTTTTISLQPTTAPPPPTTTAIPPPMKQPVLKPPPGLPEPRRTMTPQRKLLMSSTPRQLLDLTPADLNTAIHEPSTPYRELLSPKVAARRVEPLLLKKRDWKSTRIDYVTWDLKCDMRFGKCGNSSSQPTKMNFSFLNVVKPKTNGENE